MPSGLTPRHYQIDGIDWLTTPNVKLKPILPEPNLCRHLLSDAPGSGKTPQSIWATQAIFKKYCQLGAGGIVFAPAHLCKQWFEYFREYFPDETVLWLEGSRQDKERDSTFRARFTIVSIQSLRQHEYMTKLLTRIIIQNHVQVAIVDESHYCKNKDAIQSQVVRNLTRPELVPHAILLTATPIVKEADDLYMQLRILDPTTFSSYYDFLQRYCWYTMTSWGAQDVTLKRGALDSLSNWIMGRTYAQIGLELPPIIPTVHPHRLVSNRRKAYDDIRDYWYTEFKTGESFAASSAMEVMHLLRHITDGPDKLADLTSFLHDDPLPVLVACEYRLSAKNIAQAIHKAHPSLKVSVITGEIDADERVLLARDKSNQVIVATLKSLSEGCDLSHCNSVYWYEEDWTPGKHHQFLSRVHRHRDSSIGSVTITEDNHLHVDEDPNDRPIIVRYFHADRTIDQRIHAVLDHRAVAAKDLIKAELGL